MGPGCTLIHSKFSHFCSKKLYPHVPLYRVRVGDRADWRFASTDRPSCNAATPRKYAHDLRTLSIMYRQTTTVLRTHSRTPRRHMRNLRAETFACCIADQMLFLRYMFSGHAPKPIWISTGTRRVERR